MGQRGPRPGWKKAAQNLGSPAAAEAIVLPPSSEGAQAVQPLMSAADMANPAKLSGDSLKKLAHTLGIAKSELARMSDERIRTQLKYLVHSKYETEEA